MSNDKVRAEFEEWMASQGLESEWQAERNAYKHFVAHFAYQAYQASRAALVVGLPTQFNEGDDYAEGWNNALGWSKAAIESAGVRVKP